MKKIILSILVITTILFSGCNSKKNQALERMATDIELMQIDLASSPFKHKYDPAPFEDLKDEIKSHKIKRMDVLKKLRQIYGSYNITHLNINPNFPDEFYVRRTPFNLSFINNEYRIITISKQYKKYLGWKVVEIGGIPASEAAEKYAAYMSYETPSGKKYCFNNGIFWTQLKWAGLLNKFGRLQLKVESDDGVNEVFECSSINSNFAVQSNFVSLVPQNMISIDKNALERSNVVLEASEEYKTYYFQFYGMANEFNNTYQNCLDKMIKDLETGAFNTVVFDLRYNGGGEVFQTLGFCTMVYNYKDILQKYNLAVVISGLTYSAACTYLNHLCSTFPNIVLFGEETGEAILNYTGVNFQSMPRINCTFSCPREKDSLPALEKRATDITRGALPDVEVMCTFEDIMQGVDTIYKTIYEYFN